MDAITSDDIRARSLMDFDGLGFVDGDSDPLDNVVDEANAYVTSMTGREVEDITAGSTLAFLWSKAVRMRTEQEVVWNQQDYVEDLNEDAIDIKVTGYAQTRIKPDTRKGKGMLNGWDDLHMTLLQLMTDDKLEYWQDLGYVSDSASAAQGYIAPDWDVDPTWD